MFLIDLNFCPGFKAEKLVSGMKKKVSGPRDGREWGVAMESELEFSWVITFPPQGELKTWRSV